MKKSSKDILFYTIATMIILGIGITLFVLDATTAERAQKKLENHLKIKYNEEFVVKFFGQGRGSSFEGEVYPKRYVGTSREYDSYYRGKGVVPSNFVPRDDYQTIIFKESINEYFKPKLEALFEKYTLSIFDSTYYEEKNYYPTYEKLLEGEYTVRLNGTIYIFGSIENEKDIKKYQKGIFDFVQYLKKANNFEYTKIAFIVIDERVLEDDFYDLGIKKQLIEAKENSKTEEEFLAKREKIMSQIKITNKDKSERIHGIDRGELGPPPGQGYFEYFSYTAIVGTNIISSGMYEANKITYPGWYPEELGKTYDSIEEIELRKRNYFKED